MARRVTIEFAGGSTIYPESNPALLTVLQMPTLIRCGVCGDNVDATNDPEEMNEIIALAWILDHAYKCGEAI